MNTAAFTAAVAAYRPPRAVKLCRCLLPDERPDWIFTVHAQADGSQPRLTFDFSDDDDDFGGPLDSWLDLLGQPGAPLTLPGVSVPATIAAELRAFLTAHLLHWQEHRGRS